MAEVTLERVEKRYGSLVVVPELDLKIADGEFAVLVGPSGCGKTTTLQMIAGLESVSSGRLLAVATSPRCCRRSATSRWCFSPTRCFRI